MLQVIAKYASAAAVLGVLASGSFHVNAQEAERAPQTSSVTVRYNDLNLNTPAGVDALYGRLRAAAREVCNIGERRALVESMEAKACYRQTLDSAVDHVQSPPLSALHRVSAPHRAESRRS